MHSCGHLKTINLNPIVNLLPDSSPTTVITVITTKTASTKTETWGAIYQLEVVGVDVTGRHSVEHRRSISPISKVVGVDVTRRHNFEHQSSISPMCHTHQDHLLVTTGRSFRNLTIEPSLPNNPGYPP